MSQPMSIGRIVHYTVSEQEAVQINRRRNDFRKFLKDHIAAGTYPMDGYVAHVGNDVQAGDQFPAMIVRVFEAAHSCNLQVFLDGTDTFWACSVSEGDGGRHWYWPPRAS
jgi:hypothetical protein